MGQVSSEVESPSAPAAPETVEASETPADPKPVDDTPQTNGTPAEDSPAEPNLPRVSHTSSSASVEKVDKVKVTHRRLSWRPPFFTERTKPALSTVQEHEKEHQAREDLEKYTRNLSRSEKRARRSATVVRTLIIGPSGIQPSKPKPVSRAKLAKVKSELINPKSAKKVIAQLRTMPSSDKTMVMGTTMDGEKVNRLPNGPIHAVCLAYPDQEANDKHFSQLFTATTEVTVSIRSIADASLSQLTALFSDLEIVSLITSPDLGIGQPGDGPGILSGAVPTAETVIKGVQQITPQLMALGYATGKAILPDHTGVFPPTDRMSVITYWWGFELVLPPPSIVYLSRVPSISHALINFLTGLSLVNNGVREILPFVRYISQYIDTEFNMIKQEDHGQGVVCAATWIMPAALVPRPWDFPQPPVSTKPVSPSPPTNAPPQPAPSQPSRPSSPTLLPPLPQDHPAFVTSPPNAAPPIDTTPVEVAAEGQVREGSGAGTVPEVNVVPPTPPATEKLKGKPVGLENGADVLVESSDVKEGDGDASRVNDDNQDDKERTGTELKQRQEEEGTATNGEQDITDAKANE
ncbi:hypothetical protein K474DRAFT_1586750 [Panus rudis PR-1116 ss-1]|nr:hypothetical protein K474DRAFT_1586750 [Panus rudis PR-1116 ss-1]